MVSFPDRFRSKPYAALAAILLVAAGGAGGAAAMYASRPVATMAPGEPTAISSLLGTADPLFVDRVVTVRGRVAEVYGNRFVVADASGRVLVEAGPGNDDGMLARPGQIVTVQGRYDHGVLRPSFLVRPDRTVIALRPHGGGHGEGRRGHAGRGGDRDAHAERSLPAPPPAAEAGDQAPAR